MPQLTWGVVGERFYETGIDRGVLYLDAQPGVPWNGLTSVAETHSGGDAKAYYVDGVKYLNVSSAEEFGVTIEAHTYPKEFAACDGSAVAFAGVFIAQQRRKSFGLSYRTRLGNDVDGTQHGYKIHMVYNALAEPSDRAYQSLGDSVDPINFSWSCSTKPKVVGHGLRPTAHIVVDSTKIPTQALEILEARLYGSSSVQAYLPSPAELFDLFTVNPGGVFAIGFNSVTGLSDLTPAIPGDISTTVDDGEFVVTSGSHLTGGSSDGTYSWVV